MKKILILAISSIVLLSGCSVIQPDATDVAVIIDRPYFFGHGGVREEVVPGGTRSYDYLSAHAVYVSAAPQQETVRFDDFASKDNILLDFETAIQYRITSAPTLVSKFGADWFKNNLKAQFTSIVRDEVKRYQMSEMMSSAEVSETIDKNVTVAVQKLVKEAGLPIEILNITLGRAVPNENVLDQMNKTAEQQQREKTLIAAKNAELQRKEEQEAKAAADNAYRNKMGLSPEQYLAREIAQINADACKSATSCTIVPSGVGVTMR